MITLDGMEAAGAGVQLRLHARSPEEVQPGRSPGLDVICEGILHDRPFVLTEERVPASQTFQPTLWSTNSAPVRV